MTFKAMSLAAGLALAAALTASSASAAVIIKAITGGSFTGTVDHVSYVDAFQDGDTGTFPSLTVSAGNTYDYTFSVAPGAVVILTQMQASYTTTVHHHTTTTLEDVEFTIYPGTPGAPGTAIDTSLDEVGAAVSDILGAGTYFVQLDVIRQNGELVSGGLNVTAAPVPEPATWGMMLLGSAGLGSILRRDRRKRALVQA
jgi:hypothetical protein